MKKPGGHRGCGDLVRPAALEADRLKGAGVRPELPRGLLVQLRGVEAGRRVAPHRAEACLRGRGREGVALGRAPAAGGLGEAEVVRGGEVELGVRRCCWPRQVPVERGRRRRGARGGAGC